MNTQRKAGPCQWWSGIWIFSEMQEKAWNFKQHGKVCGLFFQKVAVAAEGKHRDHEGDHCHIPREEL